MSHVRQAQRKPGSIWLVWLCVLALLAFQGLGHWHRIAHGAAGSALSQKTVAASDVWGHASGDADCRLFDQLSHEHALGASGIQLCAQVHALVPDAPAQAGADTAARWKRGARGPPISA